VGVGLGVGVGTMISCSSLQSLLCNKILIVVSGTETLTPGLVVKSV